MPSQGTERTSKCICLGYIPIPKKPISVAVFTSRYLCRPLKPCVAISTAFPVRCCELFLPFTFALCFLQRKPLVTVIGRPSSSLRACSFVNKIGDMFTSLQHGHCSSCCEKFLVPVVDVIAALFC